MRCDLMATFCFVALCGCVDVGLPAHRGTAEVLRAEQARMARDAGAPALPVRPVGSPWGLVARRVEVEGAVLHALLGPIRVDLRGGVATAASDVPPQTILTAARVARGWLFATRDTLYASPTFTGRLRALRSFACDLEPMRSTTTRLLTLSIGRERAGVTVEGEGAWWSDGAELHEVVGEQVVGVAWHDAAWGARIDAYRTVYVTHDGGATWRALDLRGALPMLLSVRDDAIEVGTEAASLRLDASDAVVVAERAADEPWTLTPTQCPLTEDEARAIRAVAERPFATLGEERSSSRCAARSERLSPSWRAPEFEVGLAGVTVEDRDDGDALRVERASGPRIGSLHGRAWANGSQAGAVVSFDGPDAPRRGSPMALTWRSDDGVGPFTGRARVRLPFAPMGDTWQVLTATRAGVLVSLSLECDGASSDDARSPCDGLVWFSARGARRVEAGLPPQVNDLEAIPTADGGAVVMGDYDTASPVACGQMQQLRRRALLAVQLGPDGAVRSRRALVDERELGTSLGFAEVDGRWGIAVVRNGRGAPLEAQMLDGRTIPLGAPLVDAVPRVCDGEGANVRVHALVGRECAVHARLAASSASGERTEFGEGIRASFERDGRGLCLRGFVGARIGQGFELHEEDFRNAYEPLRLRATSGVLRGVLDEGTRLDEVRATLHPLLP